MTIEQIFEQIQQKYPKMKYLTFYRSDVLTEVGAVDTISPNGDYIWANTCRADGDEETAMLFDSIEYKITSED